MAPAKALQPGREALFTLSIFGDEIDKDLDAQLALLTELNIGHLELRSAWGVNVLDLSDDQVQAIGDACARNSIRVSCIGSPVGKTPITDPLDRELQNLDRIMDVAKALATTHVRLFSFYPPEESGPEDSESLIAESTSRLARMTERAEDRGIVLLLENEGGLVGETPEQCRAILKGVDSPHLRFVWDTGNFTHAGVERPTDQGWPLLHDYMEWVQVKDHRRSDDTEQPAGSGDGQVPELLERLRDNGYQGFLALEPHLALAGPRGGFSGPDGMRTAVTALRGLMDDAGCRETD